jgi:hypothetical protein
VLLVTLTAALTGSLAFIRSRRALRRERDACWSVRTADHLHADIQDRWAEVSGWTRLEVMRALLYGDVDKQLAQFLDHMLADRPAYRALAARDARGELVAVAGTLPPIPLPAAAGTFTLLAADPERGSLVSMGLTVPGFLSRTALAAPASDKPGAKETILVVVQLTGAAGRRVTLTLGAAGGVPLASRRCADRRRRRPAGDRSPAGAVRGPARARTRDPGRGAARRRARAAGAARRALCGTSPRLHCPSARRWAG